MTKLRHLAASDILQLLSGILYSVIVFGNLPRFYNGTFTAKCQGQFSKKKAFFYNRSRLQKKPEPIRNAILTCISARRKTAAPARLSKNNRFRLFLCKYGKIFKKKVAFSAASGYILLINVHMVEKHCKNKEKISCSNVSLLSLYSFAAAQVLPRPGSHTTPAAGRKP